MRPLVKFSKIILGVGLAAASVGCVNSPGVSGQFDRTLTVSGPIVLELKNGSGDAKITPGATDQVRIHGELRVRALSWKDSERRAKEIAENPPIEQTGSLVRVGQDHFRMEDFTV